MASSVRLQNLEKGNNNNITGVGHRASVSPEKIDSLEQHRTHGERER